MNGKCRVKRGKGRLERGKEERMRTEKGWRGEKGVILP